MEKDKVYLPATNTAYQNTWSNPAQDDYGQELFQFKDCLIV